MVEAAAEGADFFGYAGGEVGGVGVFGDDSDEGGADNNSIGHRAELSGVVFVADAEAEANGQGADGFDFGGVPANGVEVQTAFAGGAGFGDEVKDCLLYTSGGDETGQAMLGEGLAMRDMVVG